MVEKTVEGSGCPAHRNTASRKTRRDSKELESLAPLYRDAEGVWQVRSYAEAKTILRAEGTKQAGFRAELIEQMPSTMRDPILYQEGEEHRQQRTQTAKFFTPATTSKRYRTLMESFAEELVEAFKADGKADLSEMSMKLAVQVAAGVVGLTSSVTPGLARRIERFFEGEAGRFAWKLGALKSFFRNQAHLATFYFLDVLPAIRERRKRPQEDVISHLIAKGYRNGEILTECLTYAAAGMVTTREFISVATWHLLEQPELRARFLAAAEPERQAILAEILRLEPVVGRLYRRSLQDLQVESRGQIYTLPPGALIALDIYAINADAEVVGAEPLALCPARPLPRGVQAPVMGFGDGHHRCPGAYVAMQEADIFLQRLLALETLRLDGPPELSRNETVEGYELRKVDISLV